MKLPLGSTIAGVKRVWHGSSAMGANDEFGVQTTQDVTGILATAKAQRDATDGTRFNDHMTHAGLIPATIHARLVQQAQRDCAAGGDSVEERAGVLMLQWFEENPDFKTFRGTHSFKD